MATREELYTALRNADAAGDVEAAKQIAQYIKAMPKEFKAPASTESVAMQAGRRAPSLGTVAAQGATLGFGDEAAAAVTAAIKSFQGEGRFKDLYPMYRDYLRGKAAETEKQQPIASALVGAGASLPLAAAAAAPAGLIRGAGMLPGIGRAATAGAITSGITGAGQSTAEDLEGVLRDAAKSGAIGAGTGAILQPVTAGIGAVYRQGAARVSKKSAEQMGREKVAEALSRDARGADFQKGFAGNPADQAAARVQKLGPEGRIADVGEATRGTLDVLATLPGRTKGAVEAAIRDRQALRGERIVSAAEKALGAEGKRLASTIDDLIVQRREAAAPLYQQVHALSVPKSEGLDSIVDAAKKLGATGAARQIATAERVPFTIGEKGATQYSMRDLDLLKQGLDDRIANAVNEFGRPTNVGVSLIKLRDSLVQQMDEATGGVYAQARAAYAGPSAVIDAAKAGRKALTQDDAAIGKALQGMGPSELEGFRVGAFEALRAKAGAQGGQTELMKLWRTPNLQEKLKAIFGDERAYRQFASKLAAENRMQGLESVGRGSQTAARQYGAGDLDTNALADLAGATSGSPLGMMAAASRAWNRVKTPEAVRDAMGRTLLAQGPKAQQELNALAALVRDINNRRAGQSIGAGIAASELSRMPINSNQ